MNIRKFLLKLFQIKSQTNKLAKTNKTDKILHFLLMICKLKLQHYNYQP